MDAPTRLSDMTSSDKLDRLHLHRSRLAVGTAGIGGVWGAIDEAQSIDTILFALESGVRVFDTAAAYGNAERYIGRALAQWKGERPVIGTKTGKLPSATPSSTYDFSAGAMRASVLRSLDLLGLESLDLLFLHEPEMVQRDQRDAAVDALMQMRSDGLARRLGLGGGHGAGWDGFLERGCFDVVMIYNRLDACCFDGLTDDVPRVHRSGAALQGASLLHNGLLGNRFEKNLQQKPASIAPHHLQAAARVKQLADSRGLTLSTLAHRFAFSIAQYDRVVVGPRNLEQLQAALSDWQAGALDEQLFDEVCRAIGSVGQAQS